MRISHGFFFTLVWASCFVLGLATEASAADAGMDAGIVVIDAGLPIIDAGAADGGISVTDAGAADGGISVTDAGAADGGIAVTDAGAADGGIAVTDAGLPAEDAGSPPVVVEDAGSPPVVVEDAGSPPVVVEDAGSPPVVVEDAGSPPVVVEDAGTTVPPDRILPEECMQGCYDDVSRQECSASKQLIVVPCGEAQACSDGECVDLPPIENWFNCSSLSVGMNPHLRGHFSQKKGMFPWVLLSLMALLALWGLGMRGFVQRRFLGFVKPAPRESAR